MTKATLTVLKPSPELKNGTTVVIRPGGGFMALSINSEGTDVAKYLAAKGVTDFALQYRLAHRGEGATQEFTDLCDKERQKLRELLDKATRLPADAPEMTVRIPRHPMWRRLSTRRRVR